MLIFALIFVGKRIRQTLKTLYISRFFRFVLIILYSHYYASVMLELGVPDKYAMERMGNATPYMLKKFTNIPWSKSTIKWTDKSKIIFRNFNLSPLFLDFRDAFESKTLYFHLIFPYFYPTI